MFLGTWIARAWTRKTSTISRRVTSRHHGSPVEEDSEAPEMIFWKTLHSHRSHKGRFDFMQDSRHKNGPPPKRSFLKTITSGAVGSARAVLGIDRASDEEIEKRWSICSKCEFHKHWQCLECGCVVSLKIKVASESCPKGFWQAQGEDNGSVERTQTVVDRAQRKHNGEPFCLGSAFQDERNRRARPQRDASHLPDSF